jgi:DNA-directed RNA polymerase subunit RPC12/RpoP
MKVKVREWKCKTCNQTFTERVRYPKFTKNISGEQSVQCRFCNSKLVFGSPHKEVDFASTVTQEEFDEKLMLILKRYRGSSLIQIPGIYEIVSEYLNNDVLYELEHDFAVKMEENSK